MVLGTNSASIINSLDIWTELNIAYFISRSLSGDVAAVPAVLQTHDLGEGNIGGIANGS